ncbi:hypothetical protein KIPB_005857, partial [Kipferlia bialata]|eukprot:g5857.t1
MEGHGEGHRTDDVHQSLMTMPSMPGDGEREDITDRRVGKGDPDTDRERERDRDWERLADLAEAPMEASGEEEKSGVELDLAESGFGIYMW